MVDQTDWPLFLTRTGQYPLSTTCTSKCVLQIKSAVREIRSQDQLPLQLQRIPTTLFIIIKKGRQCKTEREWHTSYQSEDPRATIPTYRPVFLKLILPAAPFSVQKILSNPPPSGIMKIYLYSFFTHHSNQ